MFVIGWNTHAYDSLVLFPNLIFSCKVDVQITKLP